MTPHEDLLCALWQLAKDDLASTDATVNAEARDWLLSDDFAWWCRLTFPERDPRDVRRHLVSEVWRRPKGLHGKRLAAVRQQLLAA